MKKPKVAAPKADHHLRVSARHIELLNSLPDFSDLSTTQLWFALPEKYRKHVPPVGSDLSGDSDRMARAVIIGMLASETQVESHIGTLFMEKSVAIQKR